MADDTIIYLPWIPPEDLDSDYRARIKLLHKRILNAGSEEEYNIRKEALASAKFWRDRVPYIVKILKREYMHALNRLDYLPSHLLLDTIHGGRYTQCVDRGGVLIKSVKNKHLEWWRVASDLPKNIYDINIAMRRLFSVSISIQSLANHIKENVKCIIQGKMNTSNKKEVIKARQEIEDAVSYSMKDSSELGTISELLRLISQHFQKKLELDHPYYFHKTKLDGIKERLKIMLSTIKELLDTKLTEESLNNKPTDAIEVGEYCLQSILPKMWNEHQNIQNLITIVAKEGYYNKSVAIQIVKSFEKGSAYRATVTRALHQKGRIPNERAMREQLQLSDTLLDCGQCTPIINQRWNNKRGRKRKPITSGLWLGSILMDLHPIEMRMTEYDCPKMWMLGSVMYPIITMDLYTVARRIDVCHHLETSKFTRLYFCPKQFPVPFNLDKVWDSISFKRLKWFIKYSSKQGDSPIHYSGKDRDLSSARFRCSQSKAGEARAQRCPFSLTVKVDQYGYYIHLYNYEHDKFVGNRYHKH